MSLSIYYVVLEAATGKIKQTSVVPERLFPPKIGGTDRIVVVTDRGLPRHHQYVLDTYKLTKPITYVEQFADIVLADEMPKARGVPDLDTLKRDRIRDVDQNYAERIAAQTGPLAAIHAEKRRQAEAGGGPLVADEADRLAILANAAAQDAALAEIERERRAVKALLRAAKTKDDLAAAVAAVSDKKGVMR